MRLGLEAKEACAKSWTLMGGSCDRIEQETLTTLDFLPAKFFAQISGALNAGNGGCGPPPWLLHCF